MKLKGLTVDSSLRDEGDWVDIPGYPGLSLKSRAADYPAYRNAVQRANRRLRQKHGSEIPVEAQDIALGECMARHLLTDWQGVFTAEDKEITFSVETAVEAMTDPDNAPLRDAAAYAAAAIAQRARPAWDDDLGNFGPVSASS